MSKYNKIMERLTVSDETRERLIEGVNETDGKKVRIVRFPALKRFVSVAACFVVLIAGVLVIKNMTDNGSDPVAAGTTGPIDQTPWGTMVYKNAADLSNASGIEIADLENLPFKPTETVYQAYEDGIAEILYSKGEDSLSYRISKGDEDNSGDYNEYSKVFEKEIDGTVYTLKGEGDLIFCALYKRGDYSYSITSTIGLTLEQIEKLH